MKRIVLVILFILCLLTGLGYARTTTTDLQLVKPLWTENVDILDDINANSDILEAFANDPLEFYSVVDSDIPNDITIDLATLATTLTVTDNESTNENNAILFTSGGDLDGGDLGIECDGDLYYNPSTGALTAKMHRVFLTDESTALNAAWYQITSSVVTGDLTGLRTRMITDAVSGGDAITGVNVRGVYGQAVAGASAHAGLLQGGLFVADLSAGGATVYNVHVLCGHYSSGANTTIGGDLYVGYLRSQTRSTNFRSVAGYDVILALENEAIEGDGEKIDSAIRIFDTNVAGDGFNYGIDMSDASITTADILLQNDETIDNSTDNRITIGGGDLNIDNNRKYLVNGTQITSDALSDVASIAMLDEAETIAGNWVNTDNPWVDNEVSDALTVTGYMQDEDINTFSELDTWVTDKTLVNTANKLSAFAATTSAELAGVISDETGTLKLVFADSPTFTTKITTPIIDLTSGQVAFPSSQAASADANTLDDYEEGTWTPVVAFGGASVDITYSIQAGLYTKVGRQVTLTCYVDLSSKGTSTGNATLTGLPFTSKNDDGAYVSVSLWLFGISFADSPQASIDKNTTQIIFGEVTNAGVITTLTNTDFANDSRIMVNATYFTE